MRGLAEMSGGGAVNSGRLGTGRSRGRATGSIGIRPNGWLAGAARARGFHVFKCHPDGVYKRMDYIRNAVGSIELGRMDDSRIAFEEAHAMRSRVLKTELEAPLVRRPRAERRHLPLCCPPRLLLLDSDGLEAQRNDNFICPARIVLSDFDRPTNQACCRKRNGVLPVTLRNWSVKWAWLLKPTSNATVPRVRGYPRPFANNPKRP